MLLGASVLLRELLRLEVVLCIWGQLPLAKVVGPALVRSGCRKVSCYGILAWKLAR